MNAYPYLKRMCGSCVELLDSTLNSQCAQDGSKLIIFMRFRKTKIDHHPISHQICQKTVISTDNIGAGTMVTMKKISKILNIQLFKQSR